jgi:hypothetical protein
MAVAMLFGLGLIGTAVVMNRAQVSQANVRGEVRLVGGAAAK